MINLFKWIGAKSIVNGEFFFSLFNALDRMNKKSEHFFKKNFNPQLIKFVINNLFMHISQCNNDWRGRKQKITFTLAQTKIIHTHNYTQTIKCFQLIHAHIDGNVEITTKVNAINLYMGFDEE